MSQFNRRTLLKVFGFAATGSLVPKSLERFIARAEAEGLDGLYSLPCRAMRGSCT